MITGLLVIMVSPIVIAGARSNVISSGGGMRFQGEIIAESCRVEAGDQQMMVNLGQISSNRFHSVGEDINPVPFDIHLQDCSTAVSQRIGLTFLGIADDKDPGVLSVGEGPGIATDVGVALFDSQDRLIPVNSPPQFWTELHKGPESLHFVAKYRATGHEVSGGVANAQALFSLTYE
jgi:fimbrial protein